MNLKNQLLLKITSTQFIDNYSIMCQNQKTQAGKACENKVVSNQPAPTPPRGAV